MNEHGREGGSNNVIPLITKATPLAAFAAAYYKMWDAYKSGNLPDAVELCNGEMGEALKQMGTCPSGGAEILSFPSGERISGSDGAAFDALSPEWAALLITAVAALGLVVAGSRSHRRAAA